MKKNTNVGKVIGVLGLLAIAVTGWYKTQNLENDNKSLEKQTVTGVEYHDENSGKVQIEAPQESFNTLPETEFEVSKTINDTSIPQNGDHDDSAKQANNYNDWGYQEEQKIRNFIYQKLSENPSININEIKCQDTICNLNYIDYGENQMMFISTFMREYTEQNKGSSVDLRSVRKEPAGTVVDIEIKRANKTRLNLNDFGQ